MRSSLPLRAHGFALALLLLVAGVCLALVRPPAALAAEGEACPNEQLRRESDINPNTQFPYSIELPDCRALEMVTSRFKAGYRPFSAVYGFSSDGDQFIAESFGGYAGTVNDSQFGAVYLDTRTESGWITTPLSPPASLFPEASLFDAAGSSLEDTLWKLRSVSQSIFAEDFYRREPAGADGQCPAGGELVEGACFTEIGPIFPPSVTEDPSGFSETISHEAEIGVAEHAIDPSEGLTRVLFSEEVNEQAFRWPGDATKHESESLYEYVGTGNTEPSLVGVTNQGTQISTVQTLAGSGLHGSQYNAISGQGSTVFFTAGEGSSALVFARIGTPGPGLEVGQATTVNVAGAPGECTVSATCNVTSAVTYEGASSDGSKVFFKAAQAELVSGDTDATPALYECELPGDGGIRPPAEAVVDSCPHLKAITVTGTGEGAEVQGVARVSEDGSHVYYVARGVLTSTPNEAGQVAHSGADNLYVYEPDPASPGQYKTAFIAMLCSNARDSGSVADSQCAASLNSATADTADWQTADERPVQATPDGQFLVFDSAGDLTAGDTSAVAQVFRYDAQDEELVRVSQGQDDYYPEGEDGNTTEDGATIPAPLYANLASARQVETASAVSEDGSYVFFQSTDALTPHATAGAQNVYEWHDGDVSLIAAGVSGTSELDRTGFKGVTPSGSDVFFDTVEQLVPGDTDTQVDGYDARIDGGFPAPVEPPGCTGESCHGTPSGSLVGLLPGSVGVPAAANSQPVRKPKPKAKALTRAQKLTDALKACRRASKKKQKRAVCEARARKRYGAKLKAKAKQKQAKLKKSGGRGK